MTRTSVTLETENDANYIEPGYARPPSVTVRLETRAVGSNGDRSDCPTISHAATATFDGQPMVLADEGGWDAPIDGSSLCHPITFTLADAPAQPGATSTLEIADGSATWTIEGADLLTNDFAFAAAPGGGRADIVWASAPAIQQAYVQFTSAAGAVLFEGSSLGLPGGNDVTIAGNTVTVTFSASNVAGTFSINAFRKPAATRCDGPASCELDLALGADLPATLR